MLKPRHARYARMFHNMEAVAVLLYTIRQQIYATASLQPRLIPPSPRYFAYGPCEGAQIRGLINKLFLGLKLCT